MPKSSRTCGSRSSSRRPHPCRSGAISQSDQRRKKTQPSARTERCAGHFSGRRNTTSSNRERRLELEAHPRRDGAARKHRHVVGLIELMPEKVLAIELERESIEEVTRYRCA